VNETDTKVVPVRQRLPNTRRAITHKFNIADHEGYIIAGCFEDGNPAEVLITMKNEGGTISGLLDVIATQMSIMLQYGIPLEVIVNKFAHQRFEPSGFTPNPDIGHAKSIIDYVVRWMGCQFIQGYREENLPSGKFRPVSPTELNSGVKCANCQAVLPSTARCGAAYNCPNCGHSEGCS